MKTLPKFVVPGAALALLLLALSSPASAQLVRTYRQDQVLSGDDVRVMMHAAAEPFDAKPEGTQVPWSNPKTGTSGTATLVKRFTAKEQECRETEYMAKSEKTSKTARYVMTLCRQPDGKWKFT